MNGKKTQKHTYSTVLLLLPTIQPSCLPSTIPLLCLLYLFIIDEKRGFLVTYYQLSRQYSNYLQQSVDQLPILLLMVSRTGKMNISLFCPRSRLRIWSRETGSAAPSGASLLILYTQAGSRKAQKTGCFLSILKKGSRKCFPLSLGESEFQTSLIEYL